MPLSNDVLLEEFPDIKEVPKPAGSEDVRKIVDALKYIRIKLSDKGHNYDPINITTSANTIYQNIRNSYQAIENAFDVLNNNEYQSAYYIKSVSRGHYEPNRAEWQRWIDILLDMYDMLSDKKGKWQYLKLTDGYLTIDNNKILIRGAITNG